VSDGERIRREVLGDEHVDRAKAKTTDFTRDFQELIERYAWGDIWARPGLDRRARSLITLTALTALGHHEELAMHVRAAKRNGLTDDEIKETLLQCAVYCGVPAANAAFRIADEVLNDSSLPSSRHVTARCSTTSAGSRCISDRYRRPKGVPGFGGFNSSRASARTSPS
jgi:4-carboxymuconolactone decarboxylase